MIDYMRIKKGDLVKVIAGKDKGKSGKVMQVFKAENKVVVEGVNASIRNIRARKEGEKGQKIEYNAPLNASNVMLIDAKTGLVTRINYKTLNSGEKIRIAKKSGEAV